MFKLMILNLIGLIMCALKKFSGTIIYYGKAMKEKQSNKDCLIKATILCQINYFKLYEKCSFFNNGLANH